MAGKKRTPSTIIELVEKNPTLAVKMTKKRSKYA